MPVCPTCHSDIGAGTNHSVIVPNAVAISAHPLPALTGNVDADAPNAQMRGLLDEPPASRDESPTQTIMSGVHPLVVLDPRRRRGAGRRANDT